MAIAEATAESIEDVRASLQSREREIEKLREALADLCGLRSLISDNIHAFDIGKDEAGNWRVWHEDYPEDGSVALVAHGEG